MNTRETLIKIAELVSDLSGLIYEEEGEYTVEYQDAFPPEEEGLTYSELKVLLETVQKENDNLMRQLAHKARECELLRDKSKKLIKLNEKLYDRIRDIKEKKREENENEKVENANNL